MGDMTTGKNSVLVEEAYAEPFPEVTVDVTDYLCQGLLCLSSCGFTLLVPGVHGRKTLRLTPEETDFVSDCGLCRDRRRRPYGELGSVDRKNCMCCVGFVLADIELYPGCGCESETVDNVVRDLKARMRTRGDTGQIQRIERVLLEVRELKDMVIALDKKIDSVVEQKMSR